MKTNWANRRRQIMDLENNTHTFTEFRDKLIEQEKEMLEKEYHRGFVAGYNKYNQGA